MLLRRVGGVKQDVLLQPSFCTLGDAVFALADKSSCSERQYYAASESIAARGERLAASLIAIKNLVVAVCKTLAIGQHSFCTRKYFET